MKIKTAELIAVGVQPKQYPEMVVPEIAFAGRSNVGKSSLINTLIGRKRLARTSSSPGKTQTINFYEVNSTFRIVDLPGYGYAKVSKTEREKWGAMIEKYLSTRENLLKVVQLVDIRHAPSTQDKQMYEWLKHFELDGFVVATKADKISKNELQKKLSVIRKELQLKPDDQIFPISSLKKQGHEDLLKAIEGLLEEE